MTPSLEEVIAGMRLAAHYEGANGSRRSPRAVDVLEYLQELAECRKAARKAKVIARLPSEREAIQRIVCANNNFGCPEVQALIAAGWTVKLEDKGITIVALQTKGD